MKILVTGGTGLIGHHLIPRLLELHHSVTVVTRNPAKAQQKLDARVSLLKGLNDRSSAITGLTPSIRCLPRKKRRR